MKRKKNRQKEKGKETDKLPDKRKNIKTKQINRLSICRQTGR